MVPMRKVASLCLCVVVVNGYNPSMPRMSAGSGGMPEPRSRFMAKTAACAAASLTGLFVAPLLVGSDSAAAIAADGSRGRMDAVIAPAVAAEAATAQFDYVKFDVQLSDSETGSFVVEVRPDWAPIGAERFTSLSKSGFFEECRFFRVLKGFVAQFGINGDPAVQAKYRSAVMKDDPVTQSNK
ncbi:unnamed protein product, partial [Hapterophycus canaliculatus]